MKKVMHVIHGLNTGGAETLVKEYALKLNKNLFDVIILCMDHYKNSPYEKILKENKIKVIYICDYMKYYEKKGIIYKYINYIQRYFLIKKYIHKEKPDILHTHLTLNCYIKFSKPKKETKIFHTVHNEPKKLWDFNRKSRKKDFLATKWLIKKYKMRFIVLHDEMRKEVNELFNVNNSIVLNNGIDFDRFKKCLDKSEMRKKLNIPINSYVVGHVGRFSPQKNHAFLVDVFNEIYKKNKNLFLLMVGNGLEKAKIEDKLLKLKLDKNYLILENRNDIPDLLNAMDCFIFPSTFEGLGISLIEAQKMKLPCFISDRVPEAAIISNLVTKLPLELPSKEWSKKITNYIPPQKIKLYDKDWDITNVVKRLENIYENKI